MSKRRWPQITTTRREVIEARTLEGAVCTVVAWRNAEDGLVVSLDSTFRCSLALSPDTYAALLDALRRLGE